MAITIKDVAKAASVSPATVSRVIADNPRISDDTKKKVRETMKHLGYYPNFQARNLVIQKTQTIGIIMADSATLAFQNPFFPEVLRGISSRAHESKFGLYLSTGATTEEIYEEVISMTQGKRVDGIILLYSRIGDKIMEYLYNSNIPFSVVGRPDVHTDSISYVDNDNVGNAREVVNYLIGLGHQGIAYMGGGLEYVVSLDRLKGYQNALEKASLSFDPDLIVNQSISVGLEEQAVRRLMELQKPPTAIVTHDDLIAYELISYLQDMKIDVPGDVSVLSFNNHSLSEHLKPPLSTVDISIYELGIHAAELVLEKIKDREAPVREITVPSRLIERGSCRSL
ncbi:LacI family transcriptional regulator [Planococcus salinarum]|uniref:LacI family transcriptional regulator n=1 Tax=Planococcus salinarum TaxID=622695 RepID=A0ABX3CZ63_9BACL|nr:LacI family DNA-binding transcriptional regulator [Planococcus salinarum]OHX50202.1 LacI family transcriptional regulator [Planococcus salinarum]TAA69151.1 LacI family transcriptional regulator [Planococcus salinarum]